MLDLNDYNSDYENKWCPGCGNFGILSSMKKAFVDLGIPPQKLLIVSGIGQAAKTPHFLKCNAFHSLHGRALPIATGAKIANHDLAIVVNSGDGDCYGEGGNHLINAIRRNIDITLLVHNNMVYGLTKGQASPTSELGMVTRIQHHGVISAPLNPISFSLSLGATFIARAFSGDGDQLSKLIQAGVKHKGFSIIDILQPCVSFNHINTHAWYKSRVYDLEKTDYASDNWMNAMELSQQWDDKIPTGIIFQKESPSFTDRIDTLKESTLINKEYSEKRLSAVLSKL
jgi:2-oxoglutarate ferredoxin oxidoreductase subunit beta